MIAGTRLRLRRKIRSAKTGLLLPNEGTLLSVTENFGRRLLLVVFDGGAREYLFDEEVEAVSEPVANAPF
jgi:hypothetical protein